MSTAPDAPAVRTAADRSASAANASKVSVCHWLALLALCAAYIQGGLVKAFDFAGAVAEMQHFGMAPAAPLAIAVIVLELGASALILTGRLRWIGALSLAAFTLMASLLANRYWELDGPARVMAMNAFYEHIGLVGGFVLVALHDIARRRRS